MFATDSWRRSDAFVFGSRYINFCDKRLVLMCVKSIEVIASYHNILTLVLVLKGDYENPKKNGAENVLRMVKPFHALKCTNQFPLD